MSTTSYRYRKDIAFDFLVLDEATEIKSESSAAFKQIGSINAFFRLALTGTPVMNNIKELFNIVEFICPGCFGLRKQFIRYYDKQISLGQLKDATPKQKLVSNVLQKNL